jgi:hypothetical protein
MLEIVKKEAELTGSICYGKYPKIPFGKPSGKPNPLLREVSAQVHGSEIH